MNESGVPIALTGIGCVLPGCATPEEYWDRCAGGYTAIRPYASEVVHTRRVPCFGHVAVEQRRAAAEAVPPKLRKFCSSSTQWGVKAARDALSHAAFVPDSVPEDRRGLFTAQGDYLFPSITSFAEGFGALAGQIRPGLPELTRECVLARGIDRFGVIKSLANNLLAVTSLSLQFRGDCGAFVQDESAPVGAFRAALFSLRHGYADVALVVCAGSYDEALTVGELWQMGRLSDGSGGVASMRPFDAKRDGAFLGEGATAFLLERLPEVRLRGAKPVALVGGLADRFSCSTDSEDVHTYRMCAEQALVSTRTPLKAIDAIVARGLAGREEDLREAELLRRLHSDAPITCVTPITGLVPGCPLELLAGVGLLSRGVVPPIPNLQEPICSRLPLYRTVADSRRVHHVLALSADWFGSHSAFHISHPEAIPA